MEDLADEGGDPRGGLVVDGKEHIAGANAGAVARGGGRDLLGAEAAGDFGPEDAVSGDVVVGLRLQRFSPARTQAASSCRGKDDGEDARLECVLHLTAPVIRVRFPQERYSTLRTKLRCTEIRILPVVIRSAYRLIIDACVDLDTQERSPMFHQSSLDCDGESPQYPQGVRHVGWEHAPGKIPQGGTRKGSRGLTEV